MDELNSIHVFIKVVESGSFSAAGRELDKAASSIARQIDWLEADLGVRLLHRNTRNQSLTEAGRVYYERMKSISQELVTAKAATRSAHEGVEGCLRVSLRTASARAMIVPAMPNLLSRYPGLDIEIEVTDERKNLFTNQIDVAVWLGEMPDSDLVARCLSPSRRVLCASPAYIEKHGAPSGPEDLRHHNCLPYKAKTYGKEWAFTRDGQKTVVSIHGNISSDDGPTLLTAAEHGIGIAVAQEYIVRNMLRDRRLVRVLPDYEIDPISAPAPLYVVFPSSRRMSKRVRVFVDFLVDLFNPSID